MEQLDELGIALSSPGLKDSIILIAGFVDAFESDDFAEGLSEQRAIAVKKYLIKHFNIASYSLITAGYGSSKLRNPKNPFAEENRRVQIINVAAPSK